MNNVERKSKHGKVAEILGFPESPKLTHNLIDVPKSGKLYISVIILWIALVVVLVFSVYNNINSMSNKLGLSNTNTVLAITASFVLTVCLLLVWPQGIRDVCAGTAYILMRKKAKKHYQMIDNFNLEFNEENPEPKVLFVYCTFNDFIPVALERSMQQNYNNFETVILDDSTKQEYRDMVDDFATKHDIKVIRREERKFFKAGALNNHLMTRNDIDYFVCLDSDEILSPDYIIKSLKYFYIFKNLACVQAEHKLWNNDNRFRDLLGVCTPTLYPLECGVRQFYGYTTFLGHGGMISKKAYDDVGGFPNVIGDDPAISMEFGLKGYKMHFAENIICEEELPVDYTAYKKRHCRWSQSDLQIFKLYSKKVIKSSNIKWFEKLDILWAFSRGTWLSIFVLPIVLSILILYSVGCINEKMIIVLVTFIVFTAAPLISRFIISIGSANIFKLLLSLVFTLLMYGSLVLVTAVTAIKGIFSKKNLSFAPTPKKGMRFSILNILRFNFWEIIIGVALLLLSWLITNSIIPVLLISASLLSSTIIMYLSNLQITNKSLKQVEQDIINFNMNRLQRNEPQPDVNHI